MKKTVNKKICMEALTMNLFFVGKVEFALISLSKDPLFEENMNLFGGYSGKWRGGIWERGIWQNGCWENGIWKTGVWKDGIWKNGYWKNGIWKNGVWKNGIWKNGVWEKGEWLGGIWLGGYDKNKKYHKNSPDKWNN